MLLFSLDEHGDFERVKKSVEPIFIAGIVFDDKTDGVETSQSEEEKTERKRNRSYYEKIIEDVTMSTGNLNIKYPDALHINRDSSNNTTVWAVKKTVNETIGEFLQNGIYEGKELLNTPRKGSYTVFAILKSDRGMSLLNNNYDDLVRDNNASNLYVHMISEFVSHMLFHNMRFAMSNDTRIKCQLATRTSEDLDYKSERAEKYLKLGYVPFSKNANGETIKSFNKLPEPLFSCYYETLEK